MKPQVLELTFKPTPKQFACWNILADAQHTEIGYGGAASGGKTWLGCFWLLSSCIVYPGTRWLMGRKELANLKKTTLATFFKVCAEYGVLPDIHFKLNQQTNVLTFTNGSEILLYDLAYAPSDPEYTRLGGLELTGAFVDESNEVAFKAIDILLTRLGRCKNDEYKLKPKLLEGFNPDKGHVYSRFYKPWTTGALPAHRAFVRALPSDNPHTSKDYLDQLGRADTVTKERLLFGNFEYDDDPTALMDYDAISDLFTNVGERGMNALTVDVARFGSDQTVLTRWDGLVATEVKIFHGIGTDETIRKVNAEEQTHQIPRSRVVVDEDGIGGGVLDHLKGAKGFVANSTPVNPKDGENYANLKAQCGFKLAELVNARRMAVRTTAEIREILTQELEQVKVKDPDKDQKKRLVPKEEIKLRIGRSPDVSDTLLMRMLLEVTGQPDEKAYEQATIAVKVLMPEEGLPGIQ